METRIRQLIGYPHCGTSFVKSLNELVTPYMHNEHIILTYDWFKVHDKADVIVIYRNPMDVYVTSKLYNRMHNLDRPPAIYNYVKDTKKLLKHFSIRLYPIIFEKYIEMHKERLPQNKTYCFGNKLIRTITNKVFYALTGVDSTHLQTSYQTNPKNNLFHWMYKLNEVPRPQMWAESQNAIYSKLGKTVEQISSELTELLGVNPQWTVSKRDY